MISCELVVSARSHQTGTTTYTKSHEQNHEPRTANYELGSTTYPFFNPAGISNPAGLGTGRMSRIRIFASAPGLPEPAGGFHRGATRGELDSILDGRMGDANT